MKSYSYRRPLVFAAILASTALGPATQAQAGLFDFLFGGEPRQAPQYYQPGYGAPLDVQVNPNRRRHRESSKPRASKERTKVANTAIDPRKHPNWYLEDSTLRRGDIVVLPTGVMVYQGGARPQTREDFAKLGESRLVSKKERDRISDMVGPPTVTAESDEALRSKEATGPTNPLQ